MATNLFGEEIAAHYEAWYETPQGRRADQQEKSLLRWLMEFFPGARTVLEVGCGTGHFTRWLRDQGFQTLGIDLSPQMLAQARSLDCLPLVLGDAHRLPFADSAFDLVVLITTLEFLHHPRQALGEALRVSRRGLLLGVLNLWSPLGLARKLSGWLRPSVYSAAHFYGVGELLRLARRVAGPKASLTWRTSIFPWGIIRSPSILPWGGFIGMVVAVAGKNWV